MTNKNLEIFYDYLFHYNPYKKLWYAFKREDHKRYFNGEKKGMMKNADLDDLTTDILMKYKTKLNETNT